MQKFLDLAVDVARQAGALQKSKCGHISQIEFKGEIDLVTEVDRACEKLIVENIQSHFPDHDILAEEGGGKRVKSDYKWIIDPLDGTTNFTHGYPLFCVSIALEFKGEIVLGVVYEPNHDELFVAQKGQGATLNGKKISVTPQADIGKCMLSTGFAYNLKKVSDNNINHFSKMLMHVQAVRRDGVAAVDLCYVACGRYDGFWELNLFPWDVAAGLLIVKEAGGKISKFDGSEFCVYDKEILASNSLIHKPMSDILTQ